MLTQDRLRELLHYDPETGVFTWLQQRRGKSWLGGVAGHLQKDTGYWKLKVEDHIYAAHRVAFFYMTGKWPPYQVDHRNLCRSNNRWSNLRLATRSQNMGNVPRRRRKGLKGTYFHKAEGKWRAQIGIGPKVNRKNISLGGFSCPAAAHFSYLIAASKHFGEFARAA